MGIRGIPAVLCLGMVLFGSPRSAAQPMDSAAAARGTARSADIAQRLGFRANGSTLEVFDALAGTQLSSLAIPERIEFCRVVGDVLLLALQTQGVAVVALRDSRRPRRQADIATDTAIAAIDAAQRVVVLYSRDGKSTLEYDLSSPQAPRLLRMVAQAPGSAPAASACEHRGAPHSTEEVTATGSLRLITRRDGTQVTGRVLQVVPQEPVTVRTASHEDVVIPWDDIRRIEELRSGPALSPEATRQRPFEPLGVGFQRQPATDPEVPRPARPSPNRARVAGIVIGSVLAGVVTIAT